MSFDLRPWEFSASGTLRSGPSAGEGGLSPANHLPLLSAGARATTAFSVADGRTTTAGSPGPRVTSPTTSPRGLMTGAPNPSVATEVDSSNQSCSPAACFLETVLSTIDTFPLPNGLCTIATLAPLSITA